MKRFAVIVFGVFLGPWCSCELNVVYQWDKIDLSLRDSDRDQGYVPENNMVYRMKIWNDTLYVAIPRFRRGVPATLCKSRSNVGRTTTSTNVLQPFPTLGLQTQGNCFGMQSVKDMEIDHLGQLWMLDVGWVYDLEPVVDRACAPKLFVVDLNTTTVVRSAVLPPALYTARSVLSGISLDLKSLTAVVADIGPDDPGFIVYNLHQGIFHKFQCRTLATVRGYNEALLTVSPIDNMLYFTTVELDGLYAIPLSVFDAPAIRDVSHYVNNLGPKTDRTTAMIMDTAGDLYLAMTRKVMAWNTVKRSFNADELYVQEVRLDWISSLAFDSAGYLWIVSSPFKAFLDGSGSKSMNINIFKRYSGTTAFALQNVDYVNKTATTRNSVDKKTAAPIFVITLAVFQIKFIFNNADV